MNRKNRTMKTTLVAGLLAAASALPALAADVGVSVTIGQPGFYGHIDIGDFPTPALIYPQPVIVTPGVVVGGPIYLRVPPGHAKRWSKYCGRYNACGQRVYFVRDEWYNNVYAPRYREQHGYRDEGRGRDHDGDRGRDGGDRRGHDNPGRGHGKGHGKD
jgi:hypothetical protein